MSDVYTPDDFPGLSLEIAKMRAEQANINWHHRHDKAPYRHHKKTGSPKTSDIYGMPQNNNARIIAKYMNKEC